MSLTSRHTRAIPEGMEKETPFPAKTEFMLAGIGLAETLEIERRWLVLTEEERQQVVRRVVPLRDRSLDELLK